jgi:hypothetical protein
MGYSSLAHPLCPPNSLMNYSTNKLGMPKMAASSSSSDSSEDEDLSRFASCAVDASSLQEHAVKAKKQREEGAAKRAKARGGDVLGLASSENERGDDKEDDIMDPISVKIARALSQRIEGAIEGNIRVQDQPISSKKREVAELDDDAVGVRLFRRVKKGTAVTMDVPEPLFVQEKVRGVSAKDRCLGQRYKTWSEGEREAAISALGAEGEKMKDEVDEGIRERKKKRREDAERQRSLATEARTSEEEKKKKKKKKAKAEGTVLEGRPFVDHTERMKILTGQAS